MTAYIGRADCKLHWSDMPRIREEGFAIYDFSGWYPGKKNERKVGQELAFSTIAIRVSVVRMF